MKPTTQDTTFKQKITIFTIEHKSKIRKLQPTINECCETFPLRSMSFKEDDDVAIDAFVKKAVLLQKLATQDKTQLQNKKRVPSIKTKHKAPKHEFKGGNASFCNIRKNRTKQNKKGVFAKEHRKQNKKKLQQMKYNAKAPKHKFERGDNGFYNTRQNMIKQNKKEIFTKEHHK